MNAASDKTTATADANRRFARLAVAWYAVDGAKVDAVLRLVSARQEEGDDVDFLDALHEAGLVNDEQRHSLRHDHAPTQVFIPSPAVAPNGTPKWLLPPPPKASTGSNNGEPTQVGQYRILRRLGQGGMGAVFLAFDSVANRHVAVKVLSAEHAPNQKILKRFQLEGQHGAALAHPNLVRSLDMGQDQETGLYYIVLEYVDGPSAHELLDLAGKLKVGDAVHIVLDIARALEHAHSNQIVHRDVKPANILLMSSGLAKLSDLGLAKRRDDASNLTHTSQGIGTPYYMPYEQAMNAKMADERSDIYALGATLYHLVTGAVPFGGDSSLEIVEKKGIGTYSPARDCNPDVPERLDEIIAKMLARDPENRYQTVSDVIVDLERSQLSAPIPSFISLATALQDPIVVKRLAAPVEKTQPDMNLLQEADDNSASAKVVWFLCYRDRRGNLCKAKAPLADIQQRVRKGTIPADSEASRSPQGPFKPLAQWTEFGAALAALKSSKRAETSQDEPDVASQDIPSRWSQPIWWLAAAVVGVGILTALLLTIIYFSRGF